MKVGPVSGDLVVKLALVVVGVGAVWYVTRQVKKQVSDALDNLNPLGNIGEMFSQFSADLWNTDFMQTTLPAGAVATGTQNPGTYVPQNPWGGADTVDANGHVTDYRNQGGSILDAIGKWLAPANGTNFDPTPGIY